MNDFRSTNNEEQLQLAIRAAKTNQRDGARVMFRQLLDRNPRNETAMFWLAKIARSEPERRYWLKKLLDSNPDHVAAKKALAQMDYDRAAAENRTLVLFGGVAAVMLVLTIMVVALVFAVA